MNKLPIVAFFAYAAFIQSVNLLDILDEISRLNNANEKDVKQLLSTLDNGYESPFFEGEDGINDRYIIFFHNGSDVQLIMEAFGARVEKFDKTFAIHFLYEILDAACASMSQLSFSILRQMPQVDFIQNDEIVIMMDETTTEPPCTTQMNSYWCLARLSNATYENGNEFDYPAIGGESVTVYLMDTGIHKEHPDFTPANRVKDGSNWIRNEPYDDLNGHGTASASLIGGLRSGVAKKSIIVNVKVLNRNGQGLSSGAIAGLNWIGQQKDKGIISVSLSGPASPAFDRTVNRIYNLGFFIAAAAGNNNRDANYVSPARAANAFCVAASNYNNIRASFSNWGSVVDIIAPGDNCLAADLKSNGYVPVVGTSVSTAYVSGVAALYLSMNRDLTTPQLTNLMKQTSLPNVISDLRGSANRFLHINCTV